MATTTPGGIPLSGGNGEEDSATPVGAMNINPVQKLKRIAGSAYSYFAIYVKNVQSLQIFGSFLQRN